MQSKRTVAHQSTYVTAGVSQSTERVSWLAGWAAGVIAAAGLATTEHQAAARHIEDANRRAVIAAYETGRHDGAEDAREQLRHDGICGWLRRIGGTR